MELSVKELVVAERGAHESRPASSLEQQGLGSAPLLLLKLTKISCNPRPNENFNDVLKKFVSWTEMPRSRRAASSTDVFAKGSHRAERMDVDHVGYPIMHKTHSARMFGASLGVVLFIFLLLNAFAYR
jgi:hypothetical protein